MKEEPVLPLHLTALGLNIIDIGLRIFEASLNENAELSRGSWMVGPLTAAKEKIAQLQANPLATIVFDTKESGIVVGALRMSWVHSFFDETQADLMKACSEMIACFSHATELQISRSAKILNNQKAI